MTQNIQELLGIQETKTLLDNIENKYPELLKECYRYLSVQRIADVFQRLIAEQISVRNIKIILGALVQWGQKEKDPLVLVEHVRSHLARPEVKGGLLDILTEEPAPLFYPGSPALRQTDNGAELVGCFSHNAVSGAEPFVQALDQFVRLSQQCHTLILRG